MQMPGKSGLEVLLELRCLDPRCAGDRHVGRRFIQAAGRTAAVVRHAF